MISCKKATSIIVKKELKLASFNEKASLFVHLLICKACRLFNQQSKKIDELIQRKLTQRLILRENKKQEIAEKMKALE